MLQLPKESGLARPQRVDHRVWTLFLDDQGPAQMAQYISDMGAMISENQLRTAEHLPILTWYTFKKGIICEFFRTWGGGWSSQSQKFETC